MLLVQDYLKDQQVFRSDSAPLSPAVSVVLPTYARFASGRLARAITSVLSQSFTDLELIIVDDGSTDGTREFIQQRLAADPRVVHVRHELNSGLPALRVNEGIELARGRYLAFQFDDDSWRPEALATLVEAVERQPGPAVAVGRCLATTPHEFLIFPDGPIDLPHLFQGNSIANNSVIFPRSLVERCGMFDCHIAMRRNCDWDLWIRLARRVPFVAIDTVVADVDAGLPDSIGMTTPLDLPLVRLFHSSPRDHLLRPERWRDYQVDALRAGETEVTGALARRLYEEQITPYYERHQPRISHPGSYCSTSNPRCKIVLCAQQEYDDPLFEILMRHDHKASDSRSYKFHYQPQSQVESFWMREAEMLLLVRSLQGKGVELVDDALISERPVGYFLDDDFLNLHECGSEFDYLKPGGLFHANVTEILRRCDTVWASSRAIENSVRPINPRLVPYHGSVAEECLPADIRARNEPLRMGCTSGRYRREELVYLWPAFVRFSQQYRERVSFEFWGVDINDLPPLDSPVVQRSFDQSYLHYLEQLQAANFDVFLAPLLGEPRARLAKAPNKYYLSAVAGALGIFSDVQPYEMLPHGDTCLKVDNTLDAWYEALCAVAEMGTTKFDDMRRRLLTHVRDEFTSAAHLNTHEAALRATEFHGLTRRVRHRDGRPRIVFHCQTTDFDARKELLAQYATTLRNYGVEPSLIVENVGGSNGTAPTVYRLEQMECRTLSSEAIAAESFVKELTAFGDGPPAIVHSINDSPALARTCAKAVIPHVSRLTGIESSLAANHLFADYNRAIEASFKADGEAPFAKPTFVIDEPGDPPSGHALVSEHTRFRIAPQKPNWFGLEVMVGTHMQAAAGQLSLKIRSAAGDVLREACRELSHVEDNDWVTFWFRSIPDAATNEFVAEFALYKRDLTTRVSLYQTTPANRVRRILRRAGVKGMADNLYCRMFYQF